MVDLAPRPLPSILLLALLPVAAWFVVRPLLDPVPPLPALYTCFGFSIFAFLATLYLVPALGPTFVKANLKGKDLLKVYHTPIPESLGLVCASVYILTLLLFTPFAFSDSLSQRATTHEGISVAEFPLHQVRFQFGVLSVYLSSILSLLIATLLGFLDDVFDIRWRHKLPVPIIASIPLLIVYFAARGNTHVVVPLPLRWAFGTLVNLGPLYYVYMSLLSTFATNSINIIAGINGSEVSQALIIAASVILNDLLYLPWRMGFRLPLHLLGNNTELEFGGVWSAGMAYGSKVLVERHLLSLYFMMPLVAVCLGFLYHNWYPARVFPGDTLCYVTGMAFAVVGIQAHFSKTLLLFFIPQVFNFLLSCPQLVRLGAVSSAQVIRFDAETNLLHPSKAVLTETTIHPTSGIVLETTNLTILNFFLLHFGPMSEKSLVKVLMCSQVAGSILGFVVRYGLAGLVYDGDRR
ncbi:N-acetylglucosaminephosphotransferase [Armillaria borealis]|uniref:UDP-N-acetylglucosamine--dolichyl-phosphate N-acetylglucosaminephosphotransferase n=1 Tax=Armillaria borealis TaxID=47425 RepID=A0AA39JWR2_9AGAR|nr:N-acetylglucosaminephosphotransferase [Armillaria borealis]